MSFTDYYFVSIAFHTVSKNHSSQSFKVHASEPKIVASSSIYIHRSPLYPCGFLLVINIWYLGSFYILPKYIKILVSFKLPSPWKSKLRASDFKLNISRWRTKQTITWWASDYQTMPKFLLFKWPLVGLGILKSISF